MNMDKDTYIRNLITEEYFKQLLSEVTWGKKLKGAAPPTAPGSAGPSDTQSDDDFLQGVIPGNTPDSYKFSNIDWSKVPNGKMGAGKQSAFQAKKAGAVGQLGRIRSGGDTAEPSVKAQLEKLRNGDFSAEQPVNVGGKPTLSQISQFFANSDIKDKMNKKDRDTKDPTMFQRIRPTFSRNENPDANEYNGRTISVLTLYNIEPSDSANLAMLLNDNQNNAPEGDTFATVNVWPRRENYGKSAVTFIFYEQDIERFKNKDLPFILDYFSKRVDSNGVHIYDSPQSIKKGKNTIDKTMEYLKQDILNKMYTPESREEWFQKANEKLMSDQFRMYDNYLNAENDPSIQRLIALYDRSGALEMMCQELNISKSFGHLLSDKNAKLIKAMRSDATFVLPEKTWNEKFGRVVKPGSTPVFVKIPNVRNNTGTWRNQGPVSLTYFDEEQGQVQTVVLRSTRDIFNTFYSDLSKQYANDKDLYKQLGTQEKFFVDCLANETNPHLKTYWTLEEYDISDTEFDPEYAQRFGITSDKILTEPGFINNLNGELNEPGKEKLDMLKAQKAAEKAKEAEQAAEQGEEDNTDPRLKDADLLESSNATDFMFKLLKNYADNSNIEYHETYDPETNRIDTSASLIEVLEAIAKQLFPTVAGFHNPEMVEPLAKAAAYTICIAYKVALDKVRKLRSEEGGKGITENDYQKISPVVDYINNIIAGKKATKSNGGSLNTNIAESFDDETVDIKPKSNEYLHKVLRFVIDKMNTAFQKRNLHEMLNRMDASKKNLL